MQCFNPYRVFKFVATQGIPLLPSLLESVSIPIGFSSSLQHIGDVDITEFPAGVSIPIGFSSSLQLRDWRKQPIGQWVSIPIGFSSSLQQRICYLFSIHRKKFQSLSGFQVRCNAFFKFLSKSDTRFQSLSGFQVRCNFPPSVSVDGRNPVSIPIGFSSSLQRYKAMMPHIEAISFNPYRVFKFVATERGSGTPIYRRKFQSLSGFQVRCNFAGVGFIVPERSVSIPIGFSSSLQHIL